MNYGKKGHYARDCKNQSAVLPKNIERFRGIESKEELKGTRGCAVRHFAFCYDDRCQIHEEAKYGASYWPQEPSLEQFKGATEDEDKQDRLIYGKDIYGNNTVEDPRQSLRRERTSSNREITRHRYYAAMARTAV